MTDDELERALLALPLELPPADLRPRILAATVLAGQRAFRPWEPWLIGTLMALAAWLCIDLVHAGTPAVAALGAFLVSSGLATPAALVWLALGASAALWISNPVFMPRPRILVTKRS